MGRSVAAILVFSSNGAGNFSPLATCVTAGSSATASCSVTYTPSAVGTGTHQITGGFSITAGHTNSNFFDVTVTSGALTNQTITVAPAAPASAAYGSSFGVAATGGGSGNPVLITTTGVCSGSGSGSATITMTSGVGSCVVHYNQAGNATFNAAPEVTSATAATRPLVTVTSSSHALTYGDPAPTIVASYAGFVNGETESVLTSSPTCTTTYVDGSSVSGTPYSTSCVGAAAANYTFTYTPGSVTVTAAVVTVTASSHSVSYGDAAPTVTAGYAGFVNGETESVLTTSPTCTTTYVDGGPLSGSPYQTSCIAAAAANYTFTYTPGGVTVTAVAVTVTASSHPVT
jgi:hypothetical protein